MNATKDRSDVEAFIARHKLLYKATFVPASKAKPIEGVGNTPFVHWNIEISKPNGWGTMSVPYAMGWKHYFPNPKIISSSYLVEEATKTGRGENGAPLPAPDFPDVLSSLWMDADVLSYSSFEDWAEAVGMDPDSRAVERTYNAAKEYSQKLLSLLGFKGMQELDEAFVNNEDF